MEKKVKVSPYIKEAVAVGQDRPYVAAMINIDMENVGKLAERRQIAYTTYTDLAQKPEVYDLIGQEVERVNRDLPESTRIRKFVLLHKELDPDDEEVTRTRKVRRSFVAKKYAEIIDALFTDRPSVPVHTIITYQDGRQATMQTELAIRTAGGADGHLGGPGHHGARPGLPGVGGDGLGRPDQEHLAPRPPRAVRDLGDLHFTHQRRRRRRLRGLPGRFRLVLPEEPPGDRHAGGGQRPAGGDGGGHQRPRRLRDLVGHRRARRRPPLCPLGPHPGGGHPARPGRSQGLSLRGPGRPGPRPGRRRGRAHHRRRRERGRRLRGSLRRRGHRGLPA